MPKLSDYLVYDDSSFIIWRDGSINDPYKDKRDILKIVNNRGVLDEVPDSDTGVVVYDISGYPSNTNWDVVDLSDIPTMIEIDTRIYGSPKNTRW